MIRTTQKEIRRLARTGAAVDITGAPFEIVADLDAADRLEKIAYSAGVYGINAALYRGRRTGTLYAVTSRTTAIFQLD